MFGINIKNKLVNIAHPRLTTLYYNAGILFGGNMLSAVISILSLMILVRALSLEQYGLYVLLVAFVTIIGKFIGFQSWQAQIYYGTHIKKNDKEELLHDLFAFGFWLDLLSGITGFIIAILIMFFLPKLAGVPDDAVIETAIVALVLVFNWSSSPTAYFRLRGNFFPQTFFQNIYSIIQLLLFAILWTFGEDRLLLFLAMETVSKVLGNLLFFIYYIKKSNSQDRFFYTSISSILALRSSCDGIFKFVITTNLDAMVRSFRDFDFFIVNALIGTHAVGLYKIAKTLNAAMGKLTEAFYQSIYPDLASLVAAHQFDSLLKLMKQSAISLGGGGMILWLGFWVFGKPFLAFAFGDEFSSTYWLALWCIGSMVIWAMSLSLSPAMMAMNKPVHLFLVHVFMTIIYLFAMVWLVHQFDLVGAGIALFIFHALWAITIYFVFQLQIKKLKIIDSSIN